MKNENEVIIDDNTKRPLYTLTVGEFELLIKSWMKNNFDFNVIKQTNNSPKYLTRIETCEKLHISLPTLTRYSKLGIITARRIGNRILYSEEGLQNSMRDIPIEKLNYRR